MSGNRTDIRPARSILLDGSREATRAPWSNCAEIGHERRGAGAGSPTASAAPFDRRGVAQRRAALDAEEARWLVAAQRIALHRRFGYATLAEYLERILGYGPRAAREWLRVATALQTLPKIADALARGAHSYSAVRELTRVGRHDTE
ncbi:MAG: hypothetical protein H6708_33845, partial [Kofleriaceae bacterium]|nr:hypothetical protein [Kofleriaceae bacterium]